MTLITFKDGKPVMRDGQIGTEQQCCCGGGGDECPPGQGLPTCGCECAVTLTLLGVAIPYAPVQYAQEIVETSSATQSGETACNDCDTIKVKANYELICTGADPWDAPILNMWLLRLSVDVAYYRTSTGARYAGIGYHKEWKITCFDGGGCPSTNPFLSLRQAFTFNWSAPGSPPDEIQNSDWLSATHSVSLDCNPLP